jgi:hypothetical protein
MELDNDKAVAKLARAINAMLAPAEYVESDACTPEDRRKTSIALASA